MNFKTALFLTLPLALFGCPDNETTPVVPVPTTDTAATPTPTTPIPDPTFDIVLADGDGVDDGVGGDDDGDTLTLTITDAPAGEWEFGYAQTEVGAGGWYSESCLISDYCHPIPAPDATTGTSTLVLNGTRDINAVSDAAGAGIMLLAVDFPITGTPDLTYYVGTVDDTEDTCVVWGHEAAYYMTLNCTDPGARGTTNDN